MKIYLVEDDETLRIHLAHYLEKFGYEVFLAQNFKNILEEFKRLQPDLVLLDVNLPYFDGYFWGQKIRDLSLLPILFISSRNHPMDQVLAIEQGADDFITKPFSDEVLLAKIKGQIRRVYGDYRQEKEERQLILSDLILYPERLKVHHLDQSLDLTFQEGKLLEHLMSDYPKVSSREDLLLSLWDDETFVDDNTLSVNVTRLRKKLALIQLPDLVKTVRSVGYRLDFKKESKHENI